MAEVDALGLLPGCALYRLAADDREQVLTALADAVVAAGHARPTLVEAVRDRERRFPTGLPTPIPSAIPHTDPEHVLRAGVAVATLTRPVEFVVMGGTGETLPVELVVMLCVTAPEGQVEGLQQVLGRLADRPAVERLLAHSDAASFEAAVRTWLDGTASVPGTDAGAPEQ